MADWLVDGRPARQLAIEDRGLSYGDGLFETIAIRGGRPRFLDRHLARLARGCEVLGLPIPDAGMVAAEIDQLTGDREYASAKLILTRGAGPRGYRPPASPRPLRAVGVFDAVRADPSAGRSGVRLRVCRTPISESPLLAGLKTLNRIDQVLACAEWRDSDIQEGLMRAADGRVVCGTMSNLFVVIDEQLCSPALDRAGIAGIMRDAVLQAAEKLGEPAVIRDIGMQELELGSECFICNSQFGLWPVRSIDSSVYPVGPVTRSLRRALADLGVSECAD